MTDDSPDPRPALLFLARHGQTVWHAENRYAGSSDVDMTPAGHQQAEVLARWARQVAPDALYSSPVRRALETAAPVAAAIGLEPIVVPDLREVHFGMAEGLTIGEIHTQQPEVAQLFEADPVAGRFPGAEHPEAAADRGAGALRRIAGDHPGGTVVVVAHNTLFRLCLCRLLGIPLSTYRHTLPRLDNGTITLIRLSGAPDTPAALLSFNVPVETALVVA